MTDRTAAYPFKAGQHPAALTRHQWRDPVFARTVDPAALGPDAWSPRQRFAPPGPARACLTAKLRAETAAVPPFVIIAPDIAPTIAPTVPLEAAGSPNVPGELPAAAFEETEVLQAVEAIDHQPALLAPEADEPLPEPLEAAPPADEMEAANLRPSFWLHPAGTAAGLQPQDDVQRDEPDDGPPFGLSPPVSRDAGVRTRRFLNPAVLGSAALALTVLVTCAVLLLLLPRLSASRAPVQALFNAPMMVVRASRSGRITALAVTAGQAVAPDATLLVLHTDPPPDPAASVLRAQLEAAKTRVAALDDTLAQPAPATDAGRARNADLRRQRETAALDVARLQDQVAQIVTKPAIDIPVRAGVHGIVRSLEAQSGMDVTTGLPLIRLLDCDHAFLTLAPNGQMKAGQDVKVSLPGQPPFSAKIRPSRGVAEPPDSYVVGLDPAQLASCPVGAAATVTPVS